MTLIVSARAKAFQMMTPRVPDMGDVAAVADVADIVSEWICFMNLRKSAPRCDISEKVDAGQESTCVPKTCRPLIATPLGRDHVGVKLISDAI